MRWLNRRSCSSFVSLRVALREREFGLTLKTLVVLQRSENLSTQNKFVIKFIGLELCRLIKAVGKRPAHGTCSAATELTSSVAVSSC